MRQEKTINSPVLIASLTLAAFVFAYALDTIIGKNLGPPAKHTTSENGLPGMNPLHGPVEPSFAKKRVRANANMAHGNGIEKSRDVIAGSDTGIKKVSDSMWLVDKKALPADTKRLNQVLMQARIVPSMKRGKTIGFRIIRISPGSIYEKIGLQEGDVLMRVNSQKLVNADGFFKLYRKLRYRRNISIELYRRGKLQTFNYDIH